MGVLRFYFFFSLPHVGSNGEASSRPADRLNQRSTIRSPDPYGASSVGADHPSSVQHSRYRGHRSLMPECCDNETEGETPDPHGFVLRACNEEEKMLLRKRPCSLARKIFAPRTNGLPEAAKRPDAEKATQVTLAMCPSRVSISSCVLSCQRLTSESTPPVTAIAPSLDISRQAIGAVCG